MDNWGYVLSAYLLAFAALLGYFIRLKRRIKRLGMADGGMQILKRSNPPEKIHEGDRR